MAWVNAVFELGIVVAAVSTLAGPWTGGLERALLDGLLGCAMLILAAINDAADLVLVPLTLTVIIACGVLRASPNAHIAPGLWTAWLAVLLLVLVVVDLDPIVIMEGAAVGLLAFVPLTLVFVT